MLLAPYLRTAFVGVIAVLNYFNRETQTTIRDHIFYYCICAENISEGIFGLLIFVSRFFTFDNFSTMPSVLQNKYFPFEVLPWYKATKYNAIVNIGYIYV